MKKLAILLALIICAVTVSAESFSVRSVDKEIKLSAWSNGDKGGLSLKGEGFSYSCKQSSSTLTYDCRYLFRYNGVSGGYLTDVEATLNGDYFNVLGYSIEVMRLR